MMMMDNEDINTCNSDEKMDDVDKLISGKRNRKPHEEERENEPFNKKISESMIKCVFMRGNSLQWNLIPNEIRQGLVNYTTCDAFETDKHTS